MSPDNLNSPDHADISNPHPGPYPRNAAETAWNTSAIREALFSVMDKKDVMSGMLLSKEGFPEAVKELWRSIRIHKIKKQPKHLFNPDRSFLYTTSVNSIDCDRESVFEGPRLVNLLFQYPLSTCIKNHEHELRFKRAGIHLTDIELTSMIDFHDANAGCLAPPLPRGIPSSWTVRRKYDVTVEPYYSAENTTVAVHFIQAWLAGIGVFANSVKSLKLPANISLSDVMSANLPVMLTTPTLDRLHVDSKDLDRETVYSFYRKFIASGLVKHLSLTGRYMSRGKQPDIEDLWQVDALRTGLANLESVSIDVNDFRPMGMSPDRRFTWTAYVLPTYPDDRVLETRWNDNHDLHHLREITIRLPFIPRGHLPSLSLIAEELIKLGGPLCEYKLVVGGLFMDTSNEFVSNLLTGLLNREINGVISKVRNARPVGWQWR